MVRLYRDGEILPPMITVANLPPRIKAMIHGLTERDDELFDSEAPNAIRSLVGKLVDQADQ